ncbi:MAG TPA: ATP-binding protein [Oculatellaceae cyanobacterium]
MSNKQSFNKLRYASFVALGTLLTTGVSLLIETMLREQERLLCERLRVLLNISSSTPAFHNTPVNIAATMAIACIACLIGGLSPVPRLICWLQLFAISLLLQWLLFSVLIEPGPISFFSAIIFGGATGYLLRAQKLSEGKKDARELESVLRDRELQEARLQMVKQDEVDRRLLAADLHDQVLNDLKILNQKFQSFRGDPSEDNAKDIDKLVHQAMNGIRDVMDSLSPSVLEHLGFAPALEDCLRRASERSGEFKLRFKNNAPGEDFSQLGMIEQTLLYRLVQECGTNISKHAQASIVKLSLDITEDELLIRVTDNGKGIPSGIDQSSSRGLRYMRQRGDLIGATIAWLPGEKGSGTTVEIRMPFKSKTT